ncbi:MAG: hypothetical protein AB1673_02805 [Actinomycetota bacterium]
MFLRLGERTYDLTTRSLVVAVLDARSPDLVGRARALAAAGADLVELVHPVAGPEGTASGTDADRAAGAVRSVRPVVAVPVAVTLAAGSDPQVTAAAVAAGAVMVRWAAPAGGQPTGSAPRGPGDRGGAGRPGDRGGAGAVVVTGDRATAAAWAETIPGRVVLEVAAGQRPPAGGPALPWLVTVPAGEDGIAPAALALSLGARLVRTTDPLPARRVSDVVAAIAEAGR